MVLAATQDLFCKGSSKPMIRMLKSQEPIEVFEEIK
jgi:hypothetical protein